MQKVYSIENLDCANCAAKAEAAIRRLPGIEDASITFTTMQLRLTAQDPDAMLPLALEAARKIEPDILFTPHKEHHHSHHDCCCDHEHEHHDCCCDHEHEHHHTHDHHEHHNHESKELSSILVGAGLFVVGLVLSALLPPFHIPFFIAGYILLGHNVLLTAGKNIVRGKVFDENFLMSIATIGAFLIGEFAEGVGVMLFYRIGEHFEHKAMERSRSQIMEAVDMRPETVTLISGEIKAAADAKPGDLLLVRPGDRIPLDATVIEGESHIDSSPITGEPIPVSVKPGSSVTSGCINTDGLLTICVEKALSESMVTRILNSVENAAASKPKMDRFLTRFSRIYTPVVVALATATAIIPSLIGGNWGYWVYTALSFLVMSCPCALVLSIPLAFFCGIGTGSKQGILFKGGASIEAMAGIKAVVMDKTGTLTKGDFTLQKVEGPAELLALCAACEQHSSHPIAKSIVAAAGDVSLLQPEHIEEISGHGIIATIDGKQILCGNQKLMERHQIIFPAPDENYGTQVFVAADGQYLGCLFIADTIKPDAKAAVEQLKNAGYFTAILTGDRKENARAMGIQVGIRSVYPQLLPQEKLEQLRSIRSRKGAVMFVGDGINDAPVLAGADVGAAMGSGADAALEAADVVFMNATAQAIPQALQIARNTQRIAWQNVIFALAIKLAVMILGLTGHASMWAAVFADSGVAMLCVLNAVRMLYRKK